MAKQLLCALETTCDETGVALIAFDDDARSFRVLANALRTQTGTHERYGGVVPILAAREHRKNLPHVYKAAFAEAGVAEKDIALFVFCTGPGLAPCLVQGKDFINARLRRLQKKTVLVNHLAAHLFSALIRGKKGVQTLGTVPFPAIGLVVSGGHTFLALVKGFGDAEIVGETRDDAVGEAFDKVARILGGPYPGGPFIGEIARKGKDVFTLPRPMLGQKNLDFSFSGLKTSVLYLVRDLEKANGKLSDATRRSIARGFQRAAVEVLIAKTRAAVERYGARALLVGGGVIANDALRRALKKEFKTIPVLMPEAPLATDNALMIGFAGLLKRWFSDNGVFSPGEFDIDPISTNLIDRKDTPNL